MSWIKTNSDNGTMPGSGLIISCLKKKESVNVMRHNKFVDAELKGTYRCLSRLSPPSSSPHPFTRGKPPSCSLEAPLRRQAEACKMENTRCAMCNETWRQMHAICQCFLL